MRIIFFVLFTLVLNFDNNRFSFAHFVEFLCRNVERSSIRRRSSCCNRSRN